MAYLVGIVTIIGAPSLEDIEITSDNPFLALSKYKKFVNWIETRSLHRGHILSSEPIISISLMQAGVPTVTRLNLQALCDLFRMETPSMAQICFDPSLFLFKDEGLRISATISSARMDSSHSRGLLQPLNIFPGKKGRLIST